MKQITRRYYSPAVPSFDAPTGLDEAIEIAQRQWRMERLAEPSIERYTRDVRRMDRELNGLLGNVHVRLLTWRDRMQDRYDAGDVSASSIAGTRTALLSFFNALIKQHRWSTNPVLGVQGITPDLEKPRAIPVAEQERLCALPDTSTKEGLRDRTLLELLRHGLRQNEAVRLTIGGVDYDATEDTVFLTFPAKARANRPRDRNVPLNREGASLFARYMLDTYAPSEQARWLDEAQLAAPLAGVAAWRFAALERLLVRLRPRAEDPVFTTSTGRPLYQQWVNRMFARYRDAAGLDARHTPHGFRHRFCTELFEKEVDIRLAMRLSGHTDYRSLQRYTAVARSKAAVAVEVIGSAPIRGER